MTMFTYPGATHAQTITSVISLEQANTIADLLTAHGIGSPYTSDYIDGASRYRYLSVPAIMAVVGELPQYWTLDVSHVMDERNKANRVAAIRASFEAVEHPAIRAYLLAITVPMTDIRYLRKAEIVDRRDLIKLALTSNRSNGARAYEPSKDCTSTLHLGQAVSFWYEQASYADHTRYAVPATIAEGSDIAACNANLGKFCAALRTHDGMAGSGCTWSAELIVTEAGAFVIFDCRASISD